MAGRRTSLAALAGAKVDDVPGKSDPLLLSLPLDKLTPTRFNPRRRFGTDDELREFGQKLAREQLQPAVVVSRTAYLKLWPEETEHVGQASYVIANGERRYRASALVGRPVLEVIHKEDVAASRATFLDAVQSENNDREDLDPIERALGIDIMVTQLGGANQVAAYYDKTAGWVSQQRKLLKLTSELQDLVSNGQMPIRVARDIAGLPPERQAQAWEEQVERRRAEKEAAARMRAQPASPPVEAGAVFTAVNNGGSPGVVPALAPERAAAGFTAVEPEPSTAPVEPSASSSERGVAASTVPGPVRREPERIPDPRPEPTAEGKRFPYDSPGEAVMLLAHRMSDDAFFETVRLLVGKAASRDGDRLHGILRSAVK
ncbi:ParB/RepB/Spo0J family partition protein [Streptomyces hirsutus]|uniref:ParB/RepB/Spo0J family partition protein n=1 Tax=Streptomyces hirsutus TaxID=35620 RepID=UPI0033B2A4E7